MFGAALIKRLKEPFPDRGGVGRNLLSLVGVGVFVALFLYVLRPFGLSQVQGGLLIICAGFGLVTLVFGVAYDLLMRYALRLQMDGPSWTLGKWILQSIGLIVWIAFGNFLYMNYLGGFPGFDFVFFVGMVGNTAIVGVFPIVFAGLMIQLRASRTNEGTAAEAQEHLADHAHGKSRPIALESSQKGTLSIASGDLRYVEAMQNYVQVVFVENESLKKEVLRSTLSKLEVQLEGTGVVRCHRSFLVQVDAVEQVSGNAQGWKLKVEGAVDAEIPVSRSYIPVLKELLD